MCKYKDERADSNHGHTAQPADCEKVKVLFLDIDGVLNTDSYSDQIFAARKREALLRRLPLSSDKLANKTRDKYGALFDPSAVMQLKRIIDTSDCKIVLSSTWRRSGLQVMRSMWRDRSLPGELWGITSQFRFLSRGIEIKEFIEEQRNDLKIDIEPYVIIDDQCDILPSQRKHFVQSRKSVGITADVADKVISLFDNFINQ